MNRRAFLQAHAGDSGFFDDRCDMCGHDSLDFGPCLSGTLPNPHESRLVAKKGQKSDLSG